VLLNLIVFIRNFDSEKYWNIINKLSIMEKNLFFSLLFVPISLFACQISRAGTWVDEQPLHLIQSCEAPPPDSFRVTSFSYNYVTLAWNPVAVGDDHFLTVFSENTSNGWDSLYSVLLFNSTTYTVVNMDPEKRHKVQIRTVCVDGTMGTPSPPVFPPHGVIVELVLFGEPPSIPEAVDCHNMEYENPLIKWVGFKISRPNGEGGELSNYFQFEKVYNDQDVEARIKRVETDNVLVSANLDNKWPDIFEPIVKANMIFQVGEIVNGAFESAGFVLVELHGGGTPSVDICDHITPTRPWNPLYTFTPIIVRNSPECHGCPPSGELNTQNKAKYLIRVQNPMSTYLNVFFPEPGFIGGPKKFTLLDINGKMIFQEKVNVAEPQIAIPFGERSPGLYFLQVESEGYVQTIKVIIN
jgi:hypothetical protein